MFAVERDFDNVIENNENFTICVELVEGCLEQAVTIDYATFGGTAQGRFIAKLMLCRVFKSKTLVVH